VPSKPVKSVEDSQQVIGLNAQMSCKDGRGQEGVLEVSILIDGHQAQYRVRHPHGLAGQRTRPADRRAPMTNECWKIQKPPRSRTQRPIRKAISWSSPVPEIEVLRLLGMEDELPQAKECVTSEVTK